MSEPILSEKQRLDLAKYIAGWHFNEDTLRGIVACAVAEIDRLTAELAVLAPLQDLLKDVREDNELRRAAEIGAARQREIDVRITESEPSGDPEPIKDRASQAWGRDIRTRIIMKILGSGPCLPPFPDEAELERLRNIEREAREMLRAADWFGQPGAKYAELREALGMRSKETAPPI